jgi:uncharacterized membrane protein YfcA
MLHRAALANRTDLWLFVAGLIASSVNAAAGGGTLLSFPSLMAAGLNALSANATSTVGLVPGYLASLVGYRTDLRALRQEATRTVVPSLIGGSLGAWLLIHLGSAFFARIIPGLLIGSAALLLAQPLIARALARRETALFEHPVAVFTANFLVALYAGYFGAGAGILFLAAMGLLMKRDLQQVNAIKVVVSLIANLVAAITLVVLELRHPTGALAWRAALPLALGGIAGGYGGVRIVRRLPPTVLRGFAACVGLGIAIYFIVR